MFSRQPCYFFVRPKRNFLELWVFLGREVKAPQVRRVDRASKAKVVHTIRIRHCLHGLDDLARAISDMAAKVGTNTGADINSPM